MRTFALTLGALALRLASANQYPNCVSHPVSLALSDVTCQTADPQQESDNCYRNLVDERFAAEAVAWCPEWLAGTTEIIPDDFSNCDGNVKALSSACSCVTYTATATASSSASTSSTEVATTSSTTVQVTTTAAPTTTTTATSTEETSECETETESTAPETSTTKWTTSTITTSTTKTITQCPVTVTNCPSHSTITTVEVVVTTTVCPVTETQAPSVPPSLTPTSSAFGTVTVPKTSTGAKPTSSVPVTAGAGRVIGGFEGLAALAGLFAALL
jgi:hypothetical protein